MGHGFAGKTSLAEALLAKSGMIGAAGSVDRGSTVCDFDPLEKETKHSLRSSLCHIDYKGTRVHLIDTPGHPDFIGQAIGALDALETVAVMVSAAAGIELVTTRYLSADFAKVPEAIPIGEAAAREAAGRLARYSLSPAAYAQWRSGLGSVAAMPKVTIDEVRMSGFDVTNAEVMRLFVQVRPGDISDPAVADADTTRIAARGDFSAVAPHLSDEQGRAVLTYRATEKSWGPDYLMFDLNLATDLKGTTSWGVRVDYEKRWLNRLGGELRTSFQIGSPNIAFAEFYQPLDPGQRFFVVPAAFAQQMLSTAYAGDEAVAELDERRLGVRAEVGAVLGTSTDARVGLSYSRVRDRFSVGLPWLPQPDETVVGMATLRFNHDSLDRRVFPSRGWIAAAGADLADTALGADLDYRRAWLRLSKVVALASSASNVVTISARAGTSFHTEVPYFDQFRLGGLFNLSGYNRDQPVGREFAFASVQFRHRLGYLMETIGSDTWGGLSLEAANMRQRADGSPDTGTIGAGALYLGVNSRLGPVYWATVAHRAAARPSTCTLARRSRFTERPQGRADRW